MSPSVRKVPNMVASAPFLASERGDAFWFRGGTPGIISMDGCCARQIKIHLPDDAAPLGLGVCEA